jgi:hypothetical protein
MAWQDFLATPGAKEYYIRTTLDIVADKSSKVYRNAYRYLSLIESGERSGSQSPKYQAIIDDAKRLDRLTRNPPPPPPPPTTQRAGRIPARLYIPGTVYILVSNEWEDRHNFAVNIVNPETRNYFREVSGVSPVEQITDAFFYETGHEIRLSNDREGESEVPDYRVRYIY